MVHLQASLVCTVPASPLPVTCPFTQTLLVSVPWVQALSKSSASFTDNPLGLSLLFHLGPQQCFLGFTLPVCPAVLENLKLTSWLLHMLPVCRARSACHSSKASRTYSAVKRTGGFSQCPFHPSLCSVKAGIIATRPASLYSCPGSK